MKISIITIVLRDPEGFRRTFRSLKDQSCRDFEWIVVNGDEDSEASGEIAAASGILKKLIAEPDEGISDAFNKGVNAATGDTVIFLNAGDQFASNGVIKNLLEVLNHVKWNSSLILYGNFIHAKRGKMVECIADHNLIYKRNAINHQSAVVPKRLCLAFPFDVRLQIGMDYDFWLRCFESGAQFHKVDFPIAIFDGAGRSGLVEWQLHKFVTQYFLRKINSKRRFTLLDCFRILGIGLRVTVKQVIVRFK